MRYMGGKGRIARVIAPLVTENRKRGQTYVEPFVGSGSVLSRVDGPRIASDSNAYIVSLLCAVRDGWQPPRNVSKEQYKTAKSSGVISPLTGFMAFGCSFGGKFWGGYAQGGGRNYASESARSLLTQRASLVGAVITNRSYDCLEIPPKSLIYCDPPYGNHTGYGSGFNTSSFWAWCDSKIEEGHTVFVSEYKAPASWRCVWEKEIHNSVARDNSGKKATEKLFTK